MKIALQKKTKEIKKNNKQDCRDTQKNKNQDTTANTNKSYQHT